MPRNPEQHDRLSGFADWVLRRRILVLLLTALSVAVFGGGLMFLEVSPDSRAFFGKNNPQRQALLRLEKTYSAATEVIFILAPRGGNVFTRKTLAAVEDLTREAWKMPYSSRVDSLANFQESISRDDELIVRPLFKDARRLSDAELVKIRSRALKQTELVSNLVSSKGDVAAVIVFIVRPEGEKRDTVKIAAFARDLADKVRKANPDLDVRLTGGVLADVTFKEAGIQDMRTLIPLMFAIIVVLLWVGFRSGRATAATLLVVAFSVLAAVGMSGWTGMVINTATAGTPVIIMTLCIADCVHIITTFSLLKRAGSTDRAALAGAVRQNFSPVAVTSLTTAVGFLTLNFSESPPMRELGNIVAIGMIAGFVYSVTFLPAVMSFFTPIVRQEDSWLAGQMHKLGGWVVHRRWILLTLLLPVTIVSATGIAKIRLDDSFITYFDRSFAFRRDTEFLQERLTGLQSINFSLATGKQQGVTDPAYLKKVDAFAEWFREQPKVVYVSALSDLIKRLNKNLHNDDQAYFRIPDDPKLAAQVLLFYELSLPFGRDLKQQIDIGKSASLVSVRLGGATSAEIRKLADAGEAWLVKNAPSLKAVGTGLSVAYSYITLRNVRSMINGTVIALIIISGILLLTLRDVRIGFLSLVPNLVPAGVAFGVWGFLVGQVNLAVSVVGAITLGIVVDDTVHFLSKYMRARREQGLTPEQAVRQTFRTVGSALVMTSVVLVGGFAVLATSGFAISSDMGTLSAMTIVVALMTDLLLLPPLLLAIDRSRFRRAKTDSPAA